MPSLFYLRILCIYVYERNPLSCAEFASIFASCCSTSLLYTSYAPSVLESATIIYPRSSSSNRPSMCLECAPSNAMTCAPCCSTSPPCTELARSLLESLVSCRYERSSSHRPSMCLECTPTCSLSCALCCSTSPPCTCHTSPRIHPSLSIRAQLLAQTLNVSRMCADTCAVLCSLLQ
jgi:hypothetical protein